MARPLSESKRAALLDAATAVFAEGGLGAPTSLISARANVSEGSLFTYFKSKDELINALYKDLRVQVADSVMRDYPRRGGVFERLEHVWTTYVMWGVDHPVGRKALNLTMMSHVVTDATRAEGNALFAEVDVIEADARAQKKMRDLPPHVAGHVIKALAEMTMDLIAERPKQAKKLCAMGFELLRGALEK